MVDGGSRVRSHEGGYFCVHGTPRGAGDGPTGERQSAFHCLAVVRPRAQGSPVESWQCFGYVAFALAPPRGGNTQRPTRVTHARRAPAQHHLCTEIRAPRAQRSTSATQPILASSETLLRNSGRLPDIYIYIYIYIYNILLRDGAYPNQRRIPGSAVA